MPRRGASGRGGGTPLRADGVFAPLIVSNTPPVQIPRPTTSSTMLIGPSAGRVTDPEAITDTWEAPLAFMITRVQSPAATGQESVAGDPCALATQNGCVPGGLGCLVPGSASVRIPPGQLT